MREAEDFGQFRPMIASKLGDGFEGLHAGQQSDRGQVENGQQGMPPPLGLPNVRKAGQGFFQRQRRRSERVHASHQLRGRGEPLN